MTKSQRALWIGNSNTIRVSQISLELYNALREEGFRVAVVLNANRVIRVSKISLEQHRRLEAYGFRVMLAQ